MELISNTLGLFLEAAPWLLFGLVLAGLMQALIPEALMRRWLGGNGLWPVTKAAVIGAPLPLCSCGVMPAALGLRKAGASRESTLSFLIATPETGVDSVAVTYAMMGPFMAIARPIASVCAAIGVGMATSLAPEQAASIADQDDDHGRGGGARAMPAATDDGCHAEPVPAACCHREAQSEPTAALPPLASRVAAGLRYSFTDLYDEIVLWLALGVAIAGAVVTYVPPSLLAEVGSGLPAMLVMFLVGIPMYICATASTPLAASLMLAGISPGTVMVFLLAGPATNIGTLGIIRREFGTSVLAVYLIGLAVFTIGAGLATDWLVQAMGIDISAQLHHHQHLLPLWVQAGAAALLVLFAIPRLRRPLLDAAQLRPHA